MHPMKSYRRDPVRLDVDGHAVEVSEGTSLLEATDRAGARVPRLCHLPGRPARAVCRLCLVEIHEGAGQGPGRLVPSCAVPAEEGMRVRTETARLHTIRRLLLEMMLSEHGRCGLEGCEVESLAERHGVRGTTLPPPPSPPPRQLGGEWLEVRPELCVHCDRCIRACGDRQVITRMGLGRAVTMGFVGGGAILDTTCVGCGDCVAVCPGGVLRRSGAGGGPPERRPALPGAVLEAPRGVARPGPPETGHP